MPFRGTIPVSYRFSIEKRYGLLFLFFPQSPEKAHFFTDQNSTAFRRQPSSVFIISPDMLVASPLSR